MALTPTGKLAKGTIVTVPAMSGDREPHRVMAQIVRYSRHWDDAIGYIVRIITRDDFWFDGEFFYAEDEIEDLEDPSPAEPAELHIACCKAHSCPTCGGCLMFPCKVTANGIHPKEA